MLNVEKLEIYNTFFSEIKSFAIHTKISTKEDFKGAEESEIDDLENKINFKFKEEMRSYLRNFGHGLGIRNFELTKFTIRNILNAEKQAEKFNIKEKIFNGRLVDQWDEAAYQNNLTKICFLNFFEANHYFTFIDKNPKNPTLYHWDGLDESYKNHLTIAGSLRGELYYGLKFICDLRRWKNEGTSPGYLIDKYQRTRQIKIDNLKWLRLFKEKRVDSNLFTMLRYEFEIKIKEIEIKENRIMGIHEYGEKLEKLLKKNAA